MSMPASGYLWAGPGYFEPSLRSAEPWAAYRADHESK